MCARRLERHRLTSAAQVVPDDVSGDLADVAAAICGAHAQVLSAAEISLGLRSTADASQVRHALWRDRTLVKTFGPRGTVHLLAARDLPMWTAALSALPYRSPFPAGVALTPEQHETVLAAIDVALADAELTVDELSAAVVAQLGSWAGELVMPAFNGYWPRWRQAVGRAAHRGVLCFGPNRGRTVTYTSPRRWLPDFTPLPGAGPLPGETAPAGDAALAELARAYLWAYGPATAAQFARWLAVPVTFVDRLLTRLADRVQPVELAGSRAYVPAGDTDFPASVPRSLRLLPLFDAYTVGAYPRDLLFPGDAQHRALTGGQAGNIAVVLCDGIAAGVWHQRRSGRRLAVTVETFTDLTPARRRDLDDQVARVGAILDCRPELTLGPVTVGPHA